MFNYVTSDYYQFWDFFVTYFPNFHPGVVTIVKHYELMTLLMCIDVNGNFPRKYMGFGNHQ